MESHTIDAYFVPILIPSILVISSYNQYLDNKLSLLYSIVACATTLSTLASTVHTYINQKVRSRRQLTIFTALQITGAALVSILLIHIIRLNFPGKGYVSPISVRGQPFNDGSDVFRYHFFADIVPGLILLSQTQLCIMIKHDLLCKAKRTFSYGESTMISQLVSAAYLAWALTTYSKMSGAGPFTVQLTTDIILNMGFVTFITMLLPAHLFLERRSTIARYSLLSLCVVISYIVCGSIIPKSFNSNPISWLVDHIFSTHQKISLFSLWLSTMTACISFASSWSMMVGETNSHVRKVFHLAVCVVFISGYNQDIDFTRFAAGGMFIILFIVEMVRAWFLYPFGHQIEKVCKSIRGKWDNRFVTLSHIYLLIGTFLPLWILPEGSSSDNKLVLSSGLISIGVGDTAAAIVGSLIGKRRIWRKSTKTVEGLIANILAMLIFKFFWIGFTDFPNEVTFVIAAIMTAFSEALTNNCDNLVLPLVMILFLILPW